MLKNKDVLDFVETICDVLEIAVPEVFFKAPKGGFATDTTLAACSPDGKQLYISPRLLSSPFDMAYAVTHELRHAWQVQDTRDWLAGYEPSSEVSLEEYNRQPAEVDANAFSAAILPILLHRKPLFLPLSDEVKELIAARAEVIQKEILARTDLFE